MYLQHLTSRINQTNRVRTYFLDLPPITDLLIHDPETWSLISPPQLSMYEASIKQYIEVLELRRRDAQIGKEASWAALNTLGQGLMSGKIDLEINVDHRYSGLLRKS